MLCLSQPVQNGHSSDSVDIRIDFINKTAAPANPE